MSKYSDKKRKAVCAMPHCTNVGTRLRVFNGALDWYCDQHAGKVTR